VPAAAPAAAHDEVPGIFVVHHINMVHVPYRGAAAATIDMLSG
jgi:hypothetical protein